MARRCRHGACVPSCGGRACARRWQPSSPRTQPLSPWRRRASLGLPPSAPRLCSGPRWADAPCAVLTSAGVHCHTPSPAACARTRQRATPACLPTGCPQVGRLLQRMAAAGEAAPSTLGPSPVASSLPSTMAAGSTLMAAAAALQEDLEGLETVGLHAPAMSLPGLYAVGWAAAHAHATWRGAAAADPCLFGPLAVAQAVSINVAGIAPSEAGEASVAGDAAADTAAWVATSPRAWPVPARHGQGGGGDSFDFSRRSNLSRSAPS